MTELRYRIADPTGNITLLVTSPVPREKQRDTALMLMELEKSAEQVGFIEKPESTKALLRLQMMGGEFCGNASLSTAALYLLGNDLNLAELSVEVSGLTLPLTVNIKRLSGSEYEGTLNMPMPRGMEVRELDGMKLPVIELAGISHIISEGVLSKEQALGDIKKWCSELDAEALGVMLIEKNKLTPLVYVAATDTLIWENSCASGSAAAAYCLAKAMNAGGEFIFSQPGGTLSVEAQTENGEISALRLRGRVRISDEHLIYLQT